MAILASTCLVLTYFSHPVGYTNFATDDNLLRIMDYSIAYLFQLVVRLDLMLEIIYFGFPPRAVLARVCAWKDAHAARGTGGGMGEDEDC
jgi:hypothetical protein